MSVRPAEVERPLLVRRVRRAVPLPNGGPRLLVRRSPGLLSLRVRRYLAGLAVTLTAAVVVAGLGLLAGAVGEMRAGAVAPAAVETVLTVEAEDTVWDVARLVAPGSSGPELAAVAERIVTDNSLASVELRPGQVLRVTAG